MGELAALATSGFWAITSVLFTFAGRRVGSVVVNRTRLVLGVILIGCAHYLSQGALFPRDAAPERWMWLSISGVIGLVLGDASLFQAFVMIGPRLSMLLMALVPVLSTFLAWVFLGESLRMIEVGAIMITVSGIAWVVMEQNGDGQKKRGKGYFLGILAGFGGALGQAVGLITAKRGLVGDFPALSGLMIRMVAATSVMWIATVLARRSKDTFSALQDRRALLWIVAASVTGPFLGVWMSLLAIDLAPVGIASTLMGLAPVLLLPVDRLLFQKRIGLHAVGGTLLAIFGVALIFFNG